ncbi:MAG: ABC transporter ATP-binding protein [Lachnospiraceae bacterium]|nr:ABC transporter ATP-binding protein [Lachnospiraceae bacterium]
MITKVLKRLELGKETALLVIFAVLSTAKDLGGVFALAYATDQIIYGGSMQKGLMLMLSVMMAGVVIASFEKRTHSVFAVRARGILYSIFCKKLLSADFSPEDVSNHHEWANIYSGDIPQMIRWFEQTYTGIIKLVSYLVGALVYSMYQSWLLTIIVIPLVGVLVLGISRISNGFKVHIDKERRAADEATKHLDQIIDAPEYIKAYSLEMAMDNRMEKVLRERMRAEKRGNTLRGIIGGVSGIASFLPGVFAGIVGSFFLIEGKITVGFLIAFIQMVMGRFQYAFPQIGDYLADTQSMKVLCKRFEQFMSCPEESTVDMDSSELFFEEPMIQFKHVSFGYEPSQYVLRDVSFSLNKTENLAIVGESGCGKSTILKLIMGYYRNQDSYSGDIMILGKELRQWPIKELRKLIAPVFQTNTLFDMTPENNVRLAAPSWSQREIEQVLDSAGVSRRLIGKSTGERGKSVSGGERQRIAIARAMAKQADIYIFDEITSALDTMTEKQLSENLNHMTKGKTSIMVSHRLDTIIGADNILYLENGEIKEQGTHEELLQINGAYASLYHKQKGGEL